MSEDEIFDRPSTNQFCQIPNLQQNINEYLAPKKDNPQFTFNQKHPRRDSQFKISVPQMSEYESDGNETGILPEKKSNEQTTDSQQKLPGC